LPTLSTARCQRGIACSGKVVWAVMAVFGTAVIANVVLLWMRNAHVRDMARDQETADRRWAKWETIPVPGVADLDCPGGCGLQARRPWRRGGVRADRKRSAGLQVRPRRRIYGTTALRAPTPEAVLESVKA